MKVSKPILFDHEELNLFDAIVGKGNRSVKVRELVKEFNKSCRVKNGKSEVVEKQLKLGEE